MSIVNDLHTISEDPPPAYHDGRAIERLPAYREGHLRRYHPYGRYTPTLFQQLLLSPYAYDFDYAPGPVTDVDVSSEPPSYENAEALIVLGRLGYTLDLKIVPRQLPPSLLASIRCVLGVRAESAPLVPPSSDAPAGPSTHVAASYGPTSSYTQLSEPTTSTSRPTKRKRDAFEGEGDSE